MTAMTEEQRQDVAAVAAQVATKLKAFYDTLPPEEQQVLAATLAQGLGGSVHLDDTAGYAAQTVAEAFAAQDDVRGQAIMIGGLWFSEPGDERRHPLPPNRVGIDGPSFDPPRLPREPEVS
jgi:hypothetical protein